MGVELLHKLDISVRQVFYGLADVHPDIFSSEDACAKFIQQRFDSNMPLVCFRNRSGRVSL